MKQTERLVLKQVKKETKTFAREEMATFRSGQISLINQVLSSPTPKWGGIKISFLKHE
jgi:hypothetical protein